MELRRFRVGKHEATAVAVSRDGTMVASGGPSKSVCLRDLSTGRELRRLGNRDSHAVGYDQLTCVAFSPGGQSVAGAEAGTTCVWDVATGRRLYRSDQTASGVAFSEDGSKVISLDLGPDTLEWAVRSRDVVTGKTVCQFGGNERSAVRYLALAPNGRRIAVGGHFRPIQVWDVATSQLASFHNSAEVSIGCLTFSPDGKTLASGNEDGTVSLWEVTTGKLRRQFKGHLGTVHALVFSADGRILASGSVDTTALIWSVTGHDNDRK